MSELFPLAMRHHQAGNLGEAERLYRLILQDDPRHGDALHLLGVLHHQSGRNEAAVELIRQAITQNARVPAFHNNLANALKALGRLDEAVKAYGRTLSLKPDHADAHYNLGLTLHTRGDLARAEASYRQALKVKPQHAEALGNLGNLLQEQGTLDEAVACYERAISVSPRFAEAHGNLGNVLKIQGKVAQAIESYGRALVLKPDYAEAHHNLGIALFESGRLDEAACAYRRALELKPGYAAAHANLGNLWKELGRKDEALLCYGQALALAPDLADARFGLALGTIPVFADTLCASVGTHTEFARALESLSPWVIAYPKHAGPSVGNHQPFYLAYRPTDATALLSGYGDLVGAAAQAHWQRSNCIRAARAAGSRIHLTIVSGQVRRHPVWEIVLRGLIRHLDRRQFEVNLYHTGAITDEETAWAAAHVDHFVQGPRPVAAWLDDIARARPDAIFYPEVGMDRTTCAMASLRLAPLQLAGWGHPVTTGLPSIDAFVSGELLEGPEAQRHYRERLVRLPGTGVCTEMAEVQPKPWAAPQRTAATVRFALCHQPIKFDPVHDELYARIAASSQACEFWLVAPVQHAWATARLRDRMAAAFKNAGLDPDQHLRIAPWMPRDQFTAFLNDMDVYLDCPAFSGYTTAWAAIHRGLPIVTWEGEYLRQRLASGLLRQIDLTDGIADSADRYVDIAVSLAQERLDTNRYLDRREALRQSAPRADHNQEAVHAFGQTVIAAVNANPG
jgi:protein O-GlcNAc transferase